MADPFAVGLAAIDAVMRKPVLYTGGGLVSAPITAIYSDTSGAPFNGPGNTVRQVSFEIEQSALPQRPRKNDVIERAGVRWKANDITDRDDIGRWVVVVVK
ncbi:head-tail joining protein [Sphingomonas solaris]|uniref:Uncharacterized protein n=1 Tax=Alterirhizorhabdus solaris TaxID=2529389 RepID=A0A558R843_9SPHN|nr:hypothetical protein [Sphingomonas solaris]TVV75550.1 hypothetical protein FOY91_06730 [Sphingomonas solaris]